MDMSHPAISMLVRSVPEDDPILGAPEILDLARKEWADRASEDGTLHQAMFIDWGTVMTEHMRAWRRAHRTYTPRQAEARDAAVAKFGDDILKSERVHRALDLFEQDESGTVEEFMQGVEAYVADRDALAARMAARKAPTIAPITDDEAMMAHAAAAGEIVTLRDFENPVVRPSDLSNLPAADNDSVEMQKFICPSNHITTSNAGRYEADGTLIRFSSIGCPYVTDRDRGLVCSKIAKPVPKTAIELRKEIVGGTSVPALIEHAKTVANVPGAERVQELVQVLEHAIADVNAKREFNEIAVGLAVQRTEGLPGVGKRYDDIVQGVPTGNPLVDGHERHGAVHTTPDVRIEVVTIGSGDERLSDINPAALRGARVGQCVALFYTSQGRYPVAAVLGENYLQAIADLLRLRAREELAAASSGPTNYSVDAPGVFFRDGDVGRMEKPKAIESNDTSALEK